MNPLLDENCFMPDAEARVMPDGRLYGENSSAFALSPSL